MRNDRPGSPIRWRMHLPVAPERVFAVLDADEGRAAFWAESAVEVDGSVEFRFANGETSRAAIVERVPPRTWAVDYFGGRARFELTPDDAGGTDLTLTHEGVPAEDWVETHAGWLNVLFPLKAWLVTGADLRNHDPSRSWREGYADS